MRPRQVKPGEGHNNPQGLKVISVRWEPDTFEQLRARALEKKCSVAEVIRELADYGLEAAKEMEGGKAKTSRLEKLEQLFPGHQARG